MQEERVPWCLSAPDLLGLEEPWNQKEASHRCRRMENFPVGGSFSRCHKRALQGSHQQSLPEGQAGEGLYVGHRMRGGLHVLGCSQTTFSISRVDISCPPWISTNGVGGPRNEWEGVCTGRGDW